MADPTTLKDLAASNLAAALARAGAARTTLDAAQAAVNQAVADSTAAAKALTAANADGQRIRALLAAIPTTADAQPLLAELDGATIAQRGAEAAILKAEQDLALARARLERAATGLKEAEAARVRAQTESKSADREATRVADLIAALGRPPLATLDDDATALLGSATATAAETAAEQDIPAKLLERARGRVAVARARVANRASSRDAFAAQVALRIAAEGGTEEKLAAPRAAYGSALAALESYTTGAKQRFDGAVGTLTRLADPAQKAVLTVAQKTRLNDPAQLPAREQAADLEAALDTAVRNREKAEQVRDLEKAKQAAGDTHTLAAAELDLNDKVQAVTAAEGAYGLAQRTLLSVWEAAVPDGIWADVLAYDDAIDTLNDLAVNVPSPAVLAAAEAALVSDLIELGRQQAARATYLGELASRTAAADFDAGAGQRIAFAALRGDA